MISSANLWAIRRANVPGRGLAMLLAKDLLRAGVLGVINPAGDDESAGNDIKCVKRHHGGIHWHAAPLSAMAARSESLLAFVHLPA